MSRIDCQAYLLTRHWRDTPQGIELQFWASSPLGPLRLVYPGQKAVCFIARDSDLPLPETQVERKPNQSRQHEDGTRPASPTIPPAAHVSNLSLASLRAGNRESTAPEWTAAPR